MSGNVAVVPAESEAKPAVLGSRANGSPARNNSKISADSDNSGGKPKKSISAVSIKSEVDDMTSFAKTERELLRATRMSKIMHTGGAVLSNNQGSMSTYALSEQVDKLDYFVSHNWVVKRWLKFLCLAFHFNLVSAAVASALTLAVVFGMQSSGLIPLPLTTTTGQGNATKEGILAALLPVPVFILVLFFKHDVSHRVSPGPLAFLDKTCIHQTDAALKAKSIQKLGAFLRNSDRMLVIYSDLYLQKLWTVYEVACFFTMCVDSGIEVIHVSLAPIFLTFVMFTYFISKGYWIPALPQLAVFAIVYLPGSLVFAIAFRRGHRALAATWERVSAFDARNASCFDEDDRPIVEHNISKFMKHKEFVTLDASTDDALLAFNLLVQNHVFQAIKTSLGTSPIPYADNVLALFLVNFAPRFDILSAHVVREGANDKFWMKLAYLLAINVGILPLILELLMRMTSAFLHLSGWKDWLWVGTSWISTLGLGFVLTTVIGEWVLLEMWLENKDSYLLRCLFLVYVAASLGASLAMWYSKTQKKHNSTPVSKQSEDLRTSVQSSIRATIRASRPAVDSADAHPANSERSCGKSSVELPGTVVVAIGVK